MILPLICRYNGGKYGTVLVPHSSTSTSIFYYSLQYTHWFLHGSLNVEGLQIMMALLSKSTHDIVMYYASEHT